MTRPIYIGVGGRAGSGKDPAAQVLAAFTDGPTAIVPLATGLKEMLAARYGVAVTNPLLQTAGGKASPSPNPLQEGNTVRNDLQQLGDKTRELDPQIWIRDMRRRAEQQELQYVIVPDIRYPNELAYMDLCIWVGPDAEGQHQTESALNSQDFPEELRFMQDKVGDRLEAIRADGHQLVRRAKTRVTPTHNDVSPLTLADVSPLTLNEVLAQWDEEDQLEEQQFEPLDDREPVFEPEAPPTVVEVHSDGPWTIELLDNQLTRVYRGLYDLLTNISTRVHLADYRGETVVGRGPFEGLTSTLDCYTTAAEVVDSWLDGLCGPPGQSLTPAAREKFDHEDSLELLRAHSELFKQSWLTNRRSQIYVYTFQRSMGGESRLLLSTGWGATRIILGARYAQVGQAIHYFKQHVPVL